MAGSPAPPPFFVYATFMRGGNPAVMWAELELPAAAPFGRVLAE